MDSKEDRADAATRPHATRGPGRLAGKTALITGAAQGIGRSSVKLFASEGARVIAVDRRRCAALETQRDVDYRRLDVTDAAAVKALCAAAGSVDVLFNCAGVVPEGTILDCTETEWDMAFEVNVRAMYRLIRGLLPGMLERRTGSVINMASVASSVRGVPKRFLYSATKAAVIGMTKALAADYAADGLRFNAVCPGTVDTPSLQGRIDNAPDPDAARKAFIARQPMGRLGRPEEIAALALYLAADDSAYTTGAIHVIDGGWGN